MPKKEKKLEQITYKEFVKKYHKSKRQWDFSLFTITCNKCGSDKVEFAGAIYAGTGYYEEPSMGGDIIVKCHDCGNALTLQADNLT